MTVPGRRRTHRDDRDRPGLKVTASALGAALIGLLTHLPIGALLLLVASSPILGGILGTVLLTVTSSEQGSPTTSRRGSGAGSPARR